MKHLKIFSNKNEFEESAILISKPFVALDKQTRTVYYSEDTRNLFEYKVPNNKILYQTIDGQKLELQEAWDSSGDLYTELISDSGSSNPAEVVSHTYGIIEFDYIYGLPIFDDFNRITKIYLPDGDAESEYRIKGINRCYFDNCYNLQSVKLPRYLETIDEYAFMNCSSLTSIEFYSSLVSILNNAFNNCSSLTSIKFYGSLAYISTAAFKNCTSLRSVEFSPEGIDENGYEVTLEISVSAFENCSSLTSISLPHHLGSVGDFAFKNCTSLTSIEFPVYDAEAGDSTAGWGIGVSAFENCTSLTSVEITNGLTISDYVFKDCINLSNVVISPNFDTGLISSGAFNGCTSLTSIVIPSYFGADTDAGFITPYMTNIEFKATTPPDVSDADIESFTSSNVITVPNGCLNTYLADSSWDSLNNYATIVEASV